MNISESRDQEPSLPQLPPLRTYEMRHINEEGDVETLTIQAHIATLLAPDVLQFKELIYDIYAQDGVRERTVETFNGWLRWREVPTAITSSLMIPGGGIN